MVFGGEEAALAYAWDTEVMSAFGVFADVSAWLETLATKHRNWTLFVKSARTIDSMVVTKSNR